MKLHAILMAAALAGCATGTTLVTGQTRPSTAPEAIQVFVEPPKADYEVIAVVSGSSGLGVNAQQNLDNAIAQVKRRAAAVGANAIIINSTAVPGGGGFVGTNNGGVITALSTRDAGDREVKATAIYVRN